MPAEKEPAKATLGGGCFWCLEPVFAAVRGVKGVVPGYAGGRVKNPSYTQVNTGATGHAEVVQITFDPAEITYRELLTIFFAVHDPTTPNRQGADIGPQYRSVIFYHDEDQAADARQMLADLAANGQWPDPIVTEVVPYGGFYPAEDYHHDYYRRNPAQPYCHAVITPKIAKFRREFVDLLEK